MNIKNNCDIRSAILHNIYLLSERIPIRVSGRHIHLSTQDFEQLFGAGCLRDCEDLSTHKYEVIVMTQKGVIAHVPVSKSINGHTRAEILYSDVRKLGISACVRLSDNLENTPGALLINQLNAVRIPQGVIVAERHMHIGAEKAEKLRLHSGSTVSVLVDGNRKTIFENVSVKIEDGGRFEMHIDKEEANACDLPPNGYGYLII